MMRETLSLVCVVRKVFRKEVATGGSFYYFLDSGKYMSIISDYRRHMLLMYA